MELRRVDEFVEVLHDGRWCPGDLRYWRQAPEGRWQGYVHYAAGVGLQHVAWIDQQRIRQATYRRPQGM